MIASKCIGTYKVFEKKSHKKQIIFVVLILVLIALLLSQKTIFADSNTGEKELLSSIKDQMANLDFSNIEDSIASLDTDMNLFEGSFKDKVSAILSGEYFNNYSSVFSAVIGILFDNLKSLLPLFMTIMAVAILFNILSNIRHEKMASIDNIVYFASYAIIMLLMAGVITKVSTMTLSTISTMKNQMDAIFPILLTLLTAVGGIASVGVYKPVVAILSSGVVGIVKGVLFPIFVLSFVFLIIGNLSPNAKLNKFSSFLSSCFKWIVGFVFTLFGAFLAIQGISAGKYDGVSIKATKFAVKSYVPILGGYLSDGMDFIVLSSILIKNAVGVAGLLLIFITIISPIIKIVVLKLGLQLTSAIIEPVGDNRISNLLNDCAKLMVYPIVIILATSFMYLLSVGLIMCTANVL